MSHADSIDNVGIIGRLQCGGTVEMREVIPRHMFLKRESSSTIVNIFWASGPAGSRMDSALSRKRIRSLEDRNGRRGVKSSGFSIPAPMTLDNLLRRWAPEAGNSSQRMNRRLSPNRSLIRPWWRTSSAIDVFPIPPAPTRATGSRFLAKPTTAWISSSRPKQALGGGGGNSPTGALCRCKPQKL